MGLREEAKTHRKRNRPSGTPHFGLWGQDVSITRVIQLPLCFGDKAKVRSIEVDFLLVDVPTAYNVILGWPTLHKVKAVLASYLLQLQLKADDWSVASYKETNGQLESIVLSTTGYS